VKQERTGILTPCRISFSHAEPDEKNPKPAKEEQNGDRCNSNHKDDGYQNNGKEKDSEAMTGPLPTGKIAQGSSLK